MGRGVDTSSNKIWQVDQSGGGRRGRFWKEREETGVGVGGDILMGGRKGPWEGRSRGLVWGGWGV